MLSTLEVSITIYITKTNSALCHCSLSIVCISGGRIPSAQRNEARWKSKMAEKRCDDFQVGQERSWTQRRSEIRKDSKVRENIRISLQTLNVTEVAKRLAGIARDRGNKLRRKVAGMIHVLDELTALDDSCPAKYKGILHFQEAYDLFCGAFEPELAVPDRNNFRDELLSTEIGLPVTFFTWENNSYIVLNPESWNIVRLIDVLCGQSNDKLSSGRFQLDAESLHAILDSMETEYDKSVLRAIFAATSSRSELYELGLKPDAAIKNLERVLAVSKEVENAVFAGKDMTVLALKEKVTKREKHMAELNSSIEKLRDIRANSRHIKTMEEKITVCSESLKSLQDILECKDKYSEQKFNAAARRRAQNLVNENRLRNRKAGAGAKRKLDEIDEDLIAKAIEQKTTVHGRRHDMVLYYHKRVTRDDLLNIANYNLLERGKQMIKSATTVYNRAKPKRMRSHQANRHIGNFRL